MKRTRVVLSGRVQGVFFRDTTRRRAEAEGLAGWVTNRPDGTVEAVFEGDGEAVAELLRFVEDGPGRAEVTAVERFDEEPEGLEGFEIR